MKRLGGYWIGERQAFDGDKFVCLDAYNSQECLVYSFGIWSVGGGEEDLDMSSRNDWSFEDVMDSLNCRVHAYDHTVNYPKLQGKDITFHKVGIDNKK